jgi:hypothetical protein
MHCQFCKIENKIYLCMQIKVNNDKGEEITRIFDVQWILHEMEATHLDAGLNQVQERHEWLLMTFITLEWVKNKAIEKYCEMRAHGYQMDTDKEIMTR